MRPDVNVSWFFGWVEFLAGGLPGFDQITLFLLFLMLSAMLAALVGTAAAIIVNSLVDFRAARESGKETARGAGLSL